MTRSITHLLNRTMTIKRPGRTQSGVGFVESLTTVGTGIKCRLFDIGGSDQEFAASLQMVATHVVYVEPDQDVSRDDVLTISGTDYEVRRVTEPSESVYRKLFAEEIQTGT